MWEAGGGLDVFVGYEIRIWFFKKDPLNKFLWVQGMLQSLCACAVSSVWPKQWRRLTVTGSINIGLRLPHHTWLALTVTAPDVQRQMYSMNLKSIPPQYKRFKWRKSKSVPFSEIPRRVLEIARLRGTRVDFLSQSHENALWRKCMTELKSYGSPWEVDRLSIKKLSSKPRNAQQEWYKTVNIGQCMRLQDPTSPFYLWLYDFTDFQYINEQHITKVMGSTYINSDKLRQGHSNLYIYVSGQGVSLCFRNGVRCTSWLHDMS